METHPIIEKLLEAGVEVTLAIVESPYAHKHFPVLCRVHGFYSSRGQDDDHVHLHPKINNDGTHFFVVHLDHEVHEIRQAEDLVRLNFAVWRLACERAVPPTEFPPPDGWADLYEEFGLVKKETITRYVPISGGE